MPEYGCNILRDNGFKNVIQDDKVTGFQIRVTVSYYRGIQLSQVGGYQVVADGEVFTMDKIRMSLDGEHFYSFEELANMYDTSWDFGVRAYLRVEKPGGLTRGMHEIKVISTVLVPYMGPNGVTTRQSACMTMVAPEASVPESPIKYGVSLYSYQIEVLNRQLTLEECFEEVRDAGADGIELIPQALIPDFWHMSDAFVDRWYTALDRYGLKPIGFDSFSEENTLYKRSGRELTLEDKIDVQKRFIDAAARLGFHKTRSQIRDRQVLDAVLPYAEEKDVCIGVEVHAPMKLSSENIVNTVELIQKTGTKHLALVPDFGIYQRVAPPIVLEMHIRDGAHRDLVELAKELSAGGADRDEVIAKIVEKGGNDEDKAAANRICTNSYDDPEELKNVIPYISHLHGKVWEMEEDLEDCCINYADPLRVLIENGFTGYINTEYEGNRHTQDLGPVRGIEQVRRHHAMIRKYVDQYLM